MRLCLHVNSCRHGEGKQEMKTVAQIIAETNDYCRNVGMKSEEIPIPEKVLSSNELLAKSPTHEEIISVSTFFGEKVLQLMEGVPLLIAISDQDGFILDVVGDATLKAANDLCLKRGVQFTVRAMGTNVINLSLEHPHSPIELVGNAHFYSNLHKTACYGLAFKSTETNEVLGTLLITTALEHQNPMITTMLGMTVDAIERELMHRKKNKQLNILHQVMMDNNQYGVLTTDLDGTVLEFNWRAEILLSQTARDVVGNHVRYLPIIGEHILDVLDEKKRFEDIYITIEKAGEEPSKVVCLFDSFPIYDEHSEIMGAFSQLRDVTEVYNVQQRFNYLANHDEQTGLPNRRFLKTSLLKLIEERKNSKEQCKLAIIYLDLDRFKIVNDTLGHTRGDIILKRIAKRIEMSLEPDDFIARVGGDEFVIIVPCKDKGDFPEIGERLLSIFSEPLVMNGYEFHITASMGVAIYPEDGLTPEDLLVKADTAMFHAKNIGKNKVVPYTNELNPNSHEKILLEASLRKAIESDEFVLFYQPKIDIETGLIYGLEALVRWQHPELGLIPPGEFIPMAEETGLIVHLDEWVLRKACEQNKKWQDMGISPFSVAVNLSSNQFASDKLIDLVETVLRETGLKPEYLELEITETMTMDVEHAIPMIKQLHALGVTISIDDFGTGYSSMNYLTKFAIDRLKIDRSFIWNIEKSISDSNIVKTIIRMAHNLGLKVIAEGVEDEKQLQFLQENGCNEV